MFGFGEPKVEKLKERNNVKGLIKALEYKKYAYVRMRAARALGEIGDQRAIEPLMRALSDSDRDVRKEAARVLGEIGDQRVVEPLIKALSDSNWDVHIEAAKALGKIKDQRAVEPLIKALNSVAAVEALGEIGDQRAVESLIKALNSDNDHFRRRVATALEKIGWKPSNDEIAANYWISKEKWDKCVEIGPPAVGPLIEILNKKDINDSVDIFNKRTEAINSLGKIGNQRAVEALIQILNDSNIGIRRNAAAALSKALGSACSQVPIKSLSGYDKNANVSCSELLSRTECDLSVKPLNKASNVSYCVVSEANKDALITNGWKSKNETDVQKRGKDVELLIKDLEHFKLEYIEKELDKIGWKPGNDEISARYWIFKRKWDKCVEIGSPAVGPLIECLGVYKDYRTYNVIEVRRAAVNCLMDIYKNKKIDQNVKNIILSAKILITTPHQDENIQTGAISDCTQYHEDYGIGLYFPL